LSRDERPLTVVPGWVWLALSACLALQLAWAGMQPKTIHRTENLPPAPRLAALRLASMGEPEALARLAMLYLQAYDLRGANRIPYQDLDYHRLVAWLRVVLALDPRSEYPLFSATRVYAEVPDPAKVRIVLDFIYREYLKDPNHRWQWLAQAAMVAKHRLHDLPLALQYADAIDRDTTTPNVPVWAKQMRIFILEDMNELQAAKVILGGLLASGSIKDPAELRFLRRRLEDLEARTAGRMSQEGTGKMSHP
jgi:hypothetical protein